MGVEVIGYIGAFFLTVCALPQALKSHKDGHARGLSGLMIWMWLAGEVFSLGYILLKRGIDDVPLVLNYSLSLIVIAVIFKYKYWERDVRRIAE